jgi:hypothetical protein
MLRMETASAATEPQELPQIDEAKIKQLKPKKRQIEQRGGIGSSTSNLFQFRYPDLTSGSGEMEIAIVEEAFQTDQQEVDAAGRDLPGEDFPTGFPL